MGPGFLWLCSLVLCAFVSSVLPVSLGQLVSLCDLRAFGGLWVSDIVSL